MMDSETLRKNTKSELSGLVRKHANEIKAHEKELLACMTSDEVVCLADEVDALRDHYEKAAYWVERWMLREQQAYMLSDADSNLFLHAEKKLHVVAEHFMGFADCMLKTLEAK